MKQHIITIGLVLCMSLALQAENSASRVIDITFEKPKVIDVFDKKVKRISAKKLCGYSSSKKAYEILGDALVGKWTAVNYAGYAIAGGMSIPIPADLKPVTGTTIYQQGGELVLAHPKMEAMTLKFAKKKNWKLDKKIYNDILTGKDTKITQPIEKEDAEILANCKIESLPHFIGKTTFKLQGSVMHATYRFVALNDYILYGLMEYKGTVPGGYTYSAKRSFALTKD